VTGSCEEAYPFCKCLCDDSTLKSVDAEIQRGSWLKTEILGRACNIDSTAPKAESFFNLADLNWYSLPIGKLYRTIRQPRLEAKNDWVVESVEPVDKW